jgi:hypothetical protein
MAMVRPTLGREKEERMRFQGTVEQRSSVSRVRDPRDAPGEAEVLALNQQRRDAILQVTGWPTLFAGTLNLRVPEEYAHRILLCIPVIRERGEGVKYPDSHARIPKLRVGYLYFSGRITKGDLSRAVLFRRACNPLRKDLLEAFAEERLRDVLTLSVDTSVVCEVDESS